MDFFCTKRPLADGPFLPENNIYSSILLFFPEIIEILEYDSSPKIRCFDTFFDSFYFDQKYTALETIFFISFREFDWSCLGNLTGLL